MRQVNKVCMYKFVFLVVCFWYFGQMLAFGWWSLTRGTARKIGFTQFTQCKYGAKKCKLVGN